MHEADEALRFATAPDRLNPQPQDWRKKELEC